MSSERLLKLTEKYLRQVIKTISFADNDGKGKEILGAVKGRPRTEDVEIKLDRICEELFEEFVGSLKLSVRIFSEHGDYGDSSPEYLCSIDPFDGSGLYRRGFEFEWYSVLTFFDLKGNPLVGGAADILKKRLYLANSKEKECFVKKGRERFFLSRTRKNVLDSQTRIAAYLMNRDYLLPWVDKMRDLLNKFPVFVWPNGGSCIYHMIAEGKVHAYIMCNEPRSEIDPGLAFTRAAEYPVVSVNDDGTYEPYGFLPGKQAERVPFFIAASTEELISAILKEIRPP